MSNLVVAPLVQVVLMLLLIPLPHVLHFPGMIALFFSVVSRVRIICLGFHDTSGFLTMRFLLPCQLWQDIVFHCAEMLIKDTMKLWRDTACCQTKNYMCRTSMLSYTGIVVSPEVPQGHGFNSHPGDHHSPLLAQCFDLHHSSLCGLVACSV